MNVLNIEAVLFTQVHGMYPNFNRFLVICWQIAFTLKLRGLRLEMWILSLSERFYQPFFYIDFPKLTFLLLYVNVLRKEKYFPT